MSNPFKATMGGSQGQQGGNRNFAPALIQHIQGFQGNPIQALQEKINSSGITQEQYNQLYSAAEKVVQKMMGALSSR